MTLCRCRSGSESCRVFFLWSPSSLFCPSPSWIFLWPFRVFYELCGASPFRSRMNCIPEALNLVITSALLLGTKPRHCQRSCLCWTVKVGRLQEYCLQNGCFWAHPSRSGMRGKWSGGPFSLLFGGGWRSQNHFCGHVCCLWVLLVRVYLPDRENLGWHSLSERFRVVRF